MLSKKIVSQQIHRTTWKIKTLVKNHVYFGIPNHTKQYWTGKVQQLYILFQILLQFHSHANVYSVSQVDC